MVFPETDSKRVIPGSIEAEVLNWYRKVLPGRHQDLENEYVSIGSINTLVNDFRDVIHDICFKPVEERRPMLVKPVVTPPPPVKLRNIFFDANGNPKTLLSKEDVRKLFLEEKSLPHFLLKLSAQGTFTALV